MLVRLSNPASTTPNVVKALCKPLFVLSDFWQPDDSAYNQIVLNYLEGKVI
jgi:hypothetical protein